MARLFLVRDDGDSSWIWILLLIIAAMPLLFLGFLVDFTFEWALGNFKLYTILNLLAFILIALILTFALFEKKSFLNRLMTFVGVLLPITMRRLPLNRG